MKHYLQVQMNQIFMIDSMGGCFLTTIAFGRRWWGKSRMGMGEIEN